MSYVVMAGQVYKGEDEELEKDLPEKGKVVCGSEAFKYFEKHQGALPICTETVIDMGDDSAMGESEFYTILEVDEDEKEVAGHND